MTRSVGRLRQRRSYSECSQPCRTSVVHRDHTLDCSCASLWTLKCAEGVKEWPLRRFLDELTAMGRAIPAWKEKTDAEVFAALYQLIGAVSYFAISETTLTGMYGRRWTVAIRRAFTGELATLLACATSCHGAETKQQ